MFIWEGSQVQAMETLKLALTTALALKIIDYTEDADEIICAVNVSGKE